MGIGQLVSRMTDPQNTYALTFPLTEDFTKVLRKYAGTVGFERLNLYFFIVHRDKHVKKFDATAMRAFIDQM